MSFNKYKKIMPDELFTTTMKKATRKAHAVSDALVNAKLLFALNSDKVWAEGLLIFYEIFKFLEYAVKEQKGENLGKLFMPEMNRTPAFEADLNYYLGHEWKKNYKMRDSVRIYVNYLKNLLERDPDLLMAYIYHLYMGLLSGGQILSKKRQLQSKIMKSGSNNEGEAVTDFSGQNIKDLKSQLKDKMNSIAKSLDDNKKALLVEESKKVFELNNSIIKTVKGAEKVALRNICILISCIILVALVYFYSRLLLKDKMFKLSQEL